MRRVGNAERTHGHGKTDSTCIANLGLEMAVNRTLVIIQQDKYLPEHYEAKTDIFHRGVQSQYVFAGAHGLYGYAPCMVQQADDQGRGERCQPRDVVPCLPVVLPVK